MKVLLTTAIARNMKFQKTIKFIQMKEKDIKNFKIQRKP